MGMKQHQDLSFIQRALNGGLISDAMNQLYEFKETNRNDINTDISGKFDEIEMKINIHRTQEAIEILEEVKAHFWTPPTESHVDLDDLPKSDDDHAMMKRGVVRRIAHDMLTTLIYIFDKLGSGEDRDALIQLRNRVANDELR